MPETVMTKQELTREFEAATRDVIEESDYVSADEAKRIIQRRLAKGDTEDDEEEDLETELLDDGEPVEWTEEELEEALPDDIFEAVQAHLNGDEDRDHYLAEQERELGKAAREHQSEVERRMHARAEAVAEGEADVPLNEATGLYSDDKEGN